MALRQQFLDQFPEDPDAAHQFEALTGQALGSGDHKQALALFDRYSPRVGMDPWRHDSQYANLLFFNGRYEEADQAYPRVIHSAGAPEAERWNGRFSSAYDYMQRGLYDEARGRFDSLIAEAGDNSSPTLRSVVDGARHPTHRGILEEEVSSTSRQFQGS